jgi:hypothetical protein
MAEQFSELRACITCGGKEPESEFNRGRRTICKLCDAARSRLWYRMNKARRIRANAAWKDRNRAHVNTVARKWYRDNLAWCAEYSRNRKLSLGTLRFQVSAARRAVRKALKTGLLVRRLNCERCTTVCKTQAAHASYEPGRWLDVKWLCPKCHSKWDRAEPKTRLGLRRAGLNA